MERNETYLDGFFDLTLGFKALSLSLDLSLFLEVGWRPFWGRRCEVKKGKGGEGEKDCFNSVRGFFFFYLFIIMLYNILLLQGRGGGGREGGQ